jgi:uncharacterized protein YbjT (DUF2867 family)
MKLLVFGANGGIGRHVVEQSLAAGHTVSAVTRRPETVTLRHPQLSVRRGSVLDPASLATLIDGQDAVVSAIEVASRAPTALYSRGLDNLLEVMQPAGVRRLVCISATGLDPGHFLQRWIAKPVLWRVFREMYSDLVRMAELVKSSSVDWTIARRASTMGRTPGATTSLVTNTCRAPGSSHAPTWRITSSAT